MRGRSLIKEPSGSSICAFCAHRLGAARRPSHVQRRFLQSSRPSLKPPAAGEALRENNDESSRSRPAAPSWGGGVTWGQPTWGASTSDGNKPSSGEPTRPSYAEQDLLPHEIRARQLILDSQKRKVSIRTGYGPENTRSGRPMPKARTPRTTQAERIDIARAATQRRKEREEFHARTRRSGDILPRRIMDSRHTLGDIDPPPLNAAPIEETNKASQWTNLKRRGDDQVVPETSQTSQSTPPRDDPFVIARAQRLEEAKSQNYTPLGSRSVPPPLVRAQPSRGSPSWGNGLQRQSNARVDDGAQLMEERKWNFERNDFPRSQARPDMPPERRTVGTRRIDLGAPIPEANEAPKESISHFKVMRDGGMDGERGYQRSEEERKPMDSRESQNQEERRFMEVRKREYQPSEKERRPMDSRESQNQEERRFMEVRSSRKPPARFATPKASSEVMPKGRGRDKARRREQFLADGEENEDDIEEARHRAELKRQRKREKEAKKAAAPVPILLPEYITVSNLAMALKVRVENFVEKLEELGYEETGTDFILNAEDSGLIAMEYNYEAIIDRSESEDLKPREPATDPSVLPPRPPVVTIMGHVDHGKTTLLDWLRKSSVAASEHGGITQHIGAFSVPMPSGKIITFLDTPGHSAFESMRKRGANVTDIVILVVAADDSVKPQTIEAIKHAKAAKVPIIVAINKIDKEEKNVERVKQDLARHGVDVEDFGGDTQVVCVSGKTGQGMEDLEEAASTLSEILDMRAEIDGQAEGWVLEASIKSMGKVATVLVRRGTMRPGDFIVAGKTWARIRCLRNEAGVEIDSAGPGTPVEIDGWREQPEAGDEVLQAPDESKAKSVVDYRLENEERNKMAEDMEAINEFRKAEQDKRAREKEEARLAAEAEAAQREYVPETADAKPTGPKEIPFIIKGDVSGSVEAVVNNISLLGNKEVQPLILRSGVGQVSEFDIEHAAAAKGHIISFNTSVDPHISQLAERNKVTIIDQNIIYRLVDDVRAELSTHLSPLITQRVLGEAEIAQIFEITVKGRQQKNIAGCKIRNGTVARNAKVRVLRNNEKVFDGSLASLKNVKKDVQEMKKGSECGMGFDNWFDFQVGDLIQSYEEKHEKRYL